MAEQACPGTVNAAGELRKICADCLRPTLQPHPWRKLPLDPAARRCGGDAWVCIWRLEKKDETNA